MKHAKIHVDMTIVTTDEGYAVGADLRAQGETVAIASLFYEAKSKYDVLRMALPELLKVSDADVVVFRSGMNHFRYPARLTRMLEVIAEGKTVIIARIRVKSAAILLAEDAASRTPKENIIEIL
jgi:hypothetical protein